MATEAVFVPDTSGLAGHPRGLSTLFFTEMWERFSYYGMRALLMLFMVAPAAAGGMGMSAERAAAIYGLYTGSVYFTTIPGGWIADRLLGLRRAVLVGGISIALGHYCLAANVRPLFYAVWPYREWVMLALTGVLFAWLLRTGARDATERKRIGAIIVLFVFATLFWIGFEQAGSSLTLFADQYTHNVILSWSFPSSWFQSVEPAFVITLAPVF